MISKGKKGLPLNSRREFKFVKVPANQNKRTGGPDLASGPYSLPMSVIDRSQNVVLATENFLPNNSQYAVNGIN